MSKDQFNAHPVSLETGNLFDWNTRTRYKNPTKNIVHLFDGRIFEWYVSVALLLVSVEMLIWPAMVNADVFQQPVLSLSEKIICFIFFLTGMIRILALVANGRSLSIGPRIRSYGALMGATIWFQLGIGSVKWSIENGRPAFGLVFLLSATIAELYITYRAVLDVRIRN